MENAKNLAFLFVEELLGREERFRTDISRMESRRIALVMLLPRKLWTEFLKLLQEIRSVNDCYAAFLRELRVKSS